MVAGAAVRSLLGSLVDTALFFALAFAGDAAMSGAVALPFGIAAPLWVSLAVFDFIVKAALAGLLLAPYGALMGVVRPFERAAAAR